MWRNWLAYQTVDLVVAGSSPVILATKTPRGGTRKGAASLLLNAENHPEAEIDRVTTPRGCTIAGLNEMEHQGFSSAMIKGITTSANKASSLYAGDESS